MVLHPELGSDPPIGSNQESGCDIGEQVTVFMACHGLFRVSFVARFVIVCGLLRGHCMTCL